MPHTGFSFLVKELCMGGLTGQRLHGERSDEFCGPSG